MQDKEEKKEEIDSQFLLMKMLVLESNLVATLIRLTALENILITSGIMTKEQYNETFKNISEKTLTAIQESGLNGKVNTETK